MTIITEPELPIIAKKWLSSSPCPLSPITYQSTRHNMHTYLYKGRELTWQGTQHTWIIRWPFQNNQFSLWSFRNRRDNTSEWLNFRVIWTLFAKNLILESWWAWGKADPSFLVQRQGRGFNKPPCHWQVMVMMSFFYCYSPDLPHNSFQVQSWASHKGCMLYVCMYVIIYFSGLVQSK
jgi:hypothetical protein